MILGGGGLGREFATANLLINFLFPGRPADQFFSSATSGRFFFRLGGQISFLFDFARGHLKIFNDNFLILPEPTPGPLGKEVQSQQKNWKFVGIE